MDNRKWIFAGLIGLVFVFAGYNLYSYFSQQQAIQIEEDRLAQERRAECERDRAERADALSDPPEDLYGSICRSAHFG
jgi:hypothetical protein